MQRAVNTTPTALGADTEDLEDTRATDVYVKQTLVFSKETLGAEIAKQGLGELVSCGTTDEMLVISGFPASGYDHSYTCSTTQGRVEAMLDPSTNPTWDDAKLLVKPVTE